MPSFSPVAPYYDELMQHVPYEMWVSYWDLLLMQQEIKPRRVLDVCCGTGTVAFMLARQGYQVAGIDLSAPMIAQARSKAEELGLNIRFEAMDAAEFQLGEKFDAACSFFDSFNYITDLGRLGMAFHRVAEHLHPGGSFIFDVNTAYAFEAQMFDQADTRKKTRLKYEWVGEYDPTSKIIHVHMDFWTETERFKEVHTQRAHSHEEIIDLLGDAGFGTIMAYEAYTLDRPRQKSDRIFYTCIRES